MNTNRRVRSLAAHLVLALAVCAGTAVPVFAQPVNDSFTFQGELKDGASFATGNYDFRFRLYDSLVGGSQIGAQVSTTAPLVDGKFAVTIQFPNAFTSGQQRYIEIDAAPAGSGAWVTLSPRQLLTATPNASYSITSGTSVAAQTFGGQAPSFYTNASNMSAGTLPSARLSGSYSSALTFSNIGNTYFGNGANLTGLNASNISTGTIADARLPSNIARLNTAQTFTAAQTIDFGGTALTLNDTVAGGISMVLNNAGGTALDINNNAAGLVGYGLAVDVTGTSTKYGALLNIAGDTGIGYGVFQTNNTVNGRGYYVSMTGTGTTYGAYITTSNPTGYGGYFTNTASSGINYGVYARSNSPDGYAVYGLHDASSGTTPAVYGRSDSTAIGATAVMGEINTTSGGALSSAVRGQHNGTGGGGIGVHGSHNGSGWGVYGVSTGGYGVYGNSTDGIGVRGYSLNSYGGYFDTGVAGGAALYVVGTASVGVITIRGGADLAEHFEVVNDVEEVKEGMVVMIDPEHTGGVKLAVGAYNKCVAGVVSGANDLKAGMILGEFEGAHEAKPIALTGRVWTYADATHAAIEPGDLLTTSDTPGHAMVATDPARSHGAIIGKAMSRLEKGEKGLVLVLVNLQ